MPVRLQAWDGSLAGPDDAPLVIVRSRQAVRRLVWAPDELGLARAYVAGELDVEDDLYAPFAALSSAGRLAPGESPGPSLAERLALVRTVMALGGIGREPAPPPEEVHLRRFGRLHSKRRDAAAIAHHYDIGNDFYRLVLGAVDGLFVRRLGDETVGLEAAQEIKLDLVCRKLGLGPGGTAARRRLRVGQPGDARRAGVRRGGRGARRAAPGRPSGRAGPARDRSRRRPGPRCPSPRPASGR